ncbi:hypothetical protein ACFZDF_30560 [Streptomyces sp. NPDC007910]|uniref:hypothetical protein n=1 Tax=Streptomyces sp. NPDC007910 TaxID=3364790 RepID=UPI0036E02FB6
MNTTTASTPLRQLITLWPDLTDALGDRTQHAWPPPQLRDYLSGLDRHDASEAAALRALERSPDQIGTRPVPISIPVHQTRRTVEAALAECADVIASVSQIEPITFPGKDWPAADRARRYAAARADLADPRRWRYRGKTPGARYTALWLLARVEHRPGPFRTLTEQQHRHIRLVATGALQRVEQTLDLTAGRRELTAAHPCPCGGTIEVYGGAGAQPVARCKGCGAIWSEAGVVAA